MKFKQALRVLSAHSVVLCLISCTTSTDEAQGQRLKQKSVGVEMAQVPTWSRQDLDFFLHGSMSTEVVPEAVLRAFIRAYSDLFPSQDLSHLTSSPIRCSAL